MSIASNIWKLKTDRFIASSWLFASILVPYYEANGLNSSEVYLIQAAFSAVLAFLEIPTGYFSDAVGRRASLIVGALLIPIGIGVYTLSHGFWGFILAEVFLAVGLSMRSGTDSAILFDTLVDLKREKEHKKIEGETFFLQQLGLSSANIVGAFIATFSLRLTFAINIITSLTLLPLSFSITEPKRETRQAYNMKAHLKDMGKAMKYCVRHAVIRNAALYMALVNGIGMMGYWSYYLYYTKLGLPTVAFGLLAATSSLVAGLGGKMAHVIERKQGERVAFCLPLFISANYILIGWIANIWTIPLIFLNAFLWGFAIPLLRDVMHKNTHSNIRATVLSVTSMAGRLVYIALAFIVGRIIHITSLETGFMLLGALFLIGGAYPVWALTRKPADD